MGKNRFMTIGEILEYDYIEIDWNKETDKIFLSYDVYHEDKFICKIYSFAIPLIRYDENIKNKIEFRLKKFENSIIKFNFKIIIQLRIFIQPLKNSEIEVNIRH